MRPSRPRLVPAVLALLAVAGCAGGSEETTEVGVDAYNLVIAEFLPPPAGDDEDPPVVFIARLGEEPFELDVQVSMIEAVDETHDLRFVDTVAAAIDDERAAPRDDGLLLGVGTVAATEPHLVRVEILTGTAAPTAQLLTLGRQADRWRIEMREPVEPEVLIGDE